jgi:hypothetical protein
VVKSGKKYKHNLNTEYLLLLRETKFKELVAFTFTSLHLGKLIYINEKRNVWPRRVAYFFCTSSSFLAHSSCIIGAFSLCIAPS